MSRTHKDRNRSSLYFNTPRPAKNRSHQSHSHSSNTSNTKGNTMEPITNMQGYRAYKPTTYGYVYVATEENKGLIYTINDSDFIHAARGSSGLDIREVGALNKDDKLPDKQETVPCIIMKPDDIPTTVTKSRTVASCAFHATDAFLKKFLGVTLDQDDSKWYSSNSLCTQDGLPQANTFTVLHQLVEIYGIGISHIVIPRNSRIFAEYKPFMKSLGCNPFFIADGITTNEEALEKLFPDENDRNTHRDTLFAQWRFECRDEPIKGAVLMRKFSDGPGHNGGSTFRGPRDNSKNEDWIMSMRFARTIDIKYLSPLELPAYKEYEGHREFNFMGIKDKNGQTLKEISLARWRASRTEPKLPLLLTKDESDSKSADGKYPKICQTCYNNAGNFIQSGKKVCIECGTEQKVRTRESDDLDAFYGIDTRKFEDEEAWYKNWGD